MLRTLNNLLLQCSLFFVCLLNPNLGNINTSVWEDNFNNTSVNVLNLGCGDAYQLSTIMDRYQINSYIGIDLSNAALEYTKENLAVIKIPFPLLAGPMG